MIDGDIDDLNHTEKRKASIFAIEKSNDIENNDYSENDNLPFADRILKKPKISSIKNYCNVEFIPLTSNVVERLFSIAN